LISERDPNQLNRDLVADRKIEYLKLQFLLIID